MSNYSSVSEIVPYCRMLLDGDPSFSDSTIPTRTEVDTLLDRLCGVLDMALQREGITVPITNTTAKLACDDWVTRYGVNEVKRMNPGQGFDDTNQDTMTSYQGLMKSAMLFAKENRLAFLELGIAQTRKMSDGLAFTGQDARDERSDPDDSSMEQPFFTRGQWSDSTLTPDYNDETE